MGVSGLTAFIKDNRNSVTHSVHLLPLSEQDAGEQPPHALVVDAWSFIYSLYASNLPTFSGGEYLAFHNLIKRVCVAWARVGIQPYFVFDGPTPPSKRPLVKARLEKRLQTARLFYRTSPASRSSPFFSADALVLPPFAYHVARDTLADLGVPAYYPAEGEADGYCAALANELGGWVLSADSDFAIFRGTGEEGYRGWVPIDAVQWMEVVETADGGGEEDDGFSVVKKGRGGQGKSKSRASTAGMPSLLPPRTVAGADPSKGPTLVLTVISPTDLASRLRIPPTHLPLFATLAGSDHSPPNAPALFFDSKANAVERVEKVARVLREALSPLGQERMRKQLRAARLAAGPPGSPRGAVSSSSAQQSPVLGPVQAPLLVAGDHAEAFVAHVISLMLQPSTALSRRGANRVPPEIESKLVQDVIEATCHFILPASPSLEAGEEGHCCATFPFCRCGDGSVPSAEEQRTRERYASRRRCGYMSSFTAYADPSAIWLHTGLEDPEGISPRATPAARARRRAAWNIFVDGVGGLRERPEGALAQPSADNLDLNAAADGVDGADSEQDLDAIEAAVEDDKPADAVEPQQLGEGPRVMEYLRVGASTHLGPSDLDVSERTGAAAVLAASRRDRLEHMLAAIGGSAASEASSALNQEWQLLVVMLRAAVLAAHAEGKVWHRQEVLAAVRAGIASFVRWNDDKVEVDETTIRHPLLETKNCIRLSQVLSVALDADQLTQALLLSGENDNKPVPAVYQYLDGSLWHQHLLQEQQLDAKLECVASRCLSAVGAGIGSCIKGWGVPSSPVKSSKRPAKTANGHVNGKQEDGKQGRLRYDLLSHA